jgi:hypothetical protein
VAKFTGQSTSDAFNTIDEAGLAMPLLASGTSAAGYPLHGSILSGDAVVHSVHPLEYFHGTALRLPRFHETAFAKEAKRKDYGTLYR